MRKGFTLLELIVVFGLMLAIGAVAFATLSGRKTSTDLTATTQQVVTLLRQAQSDSMEQENNAAWGVHFSNATNTVPFYALFTTSYSTATIVSGPFRLPSTVAFQTSTLGAGSTTDIIFSQISGVASASTSIGFYMPKQSTAFSSTISIASSGSVSY
jgi:type II secretory pathway pseudopilin PulG